MTREEAIKEIEERVQITEYVGSSYVDCVDIEALRIAIFALKQMEKAQLSDCISRQAAIDEITEYGSGDIIYMSVAELKRRIEQLPSAQPDAEKYEYHYDHTDCIWYRPEARNRCPSTCAQYRDGWNDAMNYIFRDGKGYRPYRRDQKYEG